MIGKRLVPALSLAALVACGGTTENAASQVLKKPELPDDVGARCSVRKSQDSPLVVEWSNPDRGRLESATRRSMVAIHYEGCQLTQLACTVKSSAGNYAYWPITVKESTLVIQNQDELFASMPVGAVKLEGKLKSAGQLDVGMAIVGRYEAPTRTFYRGDLEGKDCDQATHVVAALTVGAFTFSAGAGAEVGGGASLGPAAAGGKSNAKRETLQRDGDVTACARASAGDKAPPEGCGALIQIEVVNLSTGARPVIAPPVVAPVPTAPVEPAPPVVAPPVASNTPPKPTAKPKCKKGERVEDGVCVKIVAAKKPTTKPPIAAINPGSIKPILPTCSSGQHLDKDRCVDDLPAEPAPPPPPPVKTCSEGMKLEDNTCVPIEPPRRAEVPKPVVYDHVYQATEHPNPMRTLFAYSALGSGIVFTTLGYLALSSAAAACSDDTKSCQPDAASKQDSAVTYAIIADIALGLTALSLIGFFVVPANVKVGVTPTSNGGVASAAWRFW